MMGATWLGVNTSGSNEPLLFDKGQKIVVTLGVVALLVILFAVIVDKRSTHDTEREVWWTVACPTHAEPGRVCLDGSVSMDDIPTWAGGYAAE